MLQTALCDAVRSSLTTVEPDNVNVIKVSDVYSSTTTQSATTTVDDDSSSDADSSSDTDSDDDTATTSTSSSTSTDGVDDSRRRQLLGQAPKVADCQST